MSEGNAMNGRELMELAEARDVLLNAESDGLAGVDVHSVIIAGLSLDQEVRRLTRDLASLCARTRSAGSANARAELVKGHPLLEDRDDGGPRHYLAGRPVHAGDGLYLLTQLGWASGRYEWGFQPGTQGKFYIRLPGAYDLVVVHIPDGARLAWPDEVNGA